MALEVPSGVVAEYQITYWRELPSMVVAREGDDQVKTPLHERFQEAIDEAAMRLGDVGSDAYLAGWERSPVDGGEGSPADSRRSGRRAARGGVVAGGRHDVPRHPRRPGAGAGMNRLTTLIAGRDPVLVDGGWARCCRTRGLEPGGAGELWNVEQPQRHRRDPRGLRRGGRVDPDDQHLRRHPAAAGDARPRGPRVRPQRGGRAVAGRSRTARRAGRGRPRPDRRAAGAARHA